MWLLPLMFLARIKLKHPWTFSSEVELSPTSHEECNIWRRVVRFVIEGKGKMSIKKDTLNVQRFSGERKRRLTSNSIAFMTPYFELSFSLSLSLSFFLSLSQSSMDSARWFCLHLFWLCHSFACNLCMWQLLLATDFFSLHFCPSLHFLLSSKGHLSHHVTSMTKSPNLMAIDYYNYDLYPLWSVQVLHIKKQKYKREGLKQY